MKTKFYLPALAVGAALAGSVQADDRHSSGNSAVAARAPAAHPSTTSVHSISRGNFAGGRTIMPAKRFSSIGGRSTPTAFRQYANPSRGAPISQQFSPRTFTRGERLTRFSSPETRRAPVDNRGDDRFGQIRGENRGLVNSNGGASINQQFTSRPLNRTEGLTRFSDEETRSGHAENRRDNRLGQIGNANRGLNAAREHVFARRPADWHRDWDRNREHWWNGHCCRFVNGFWVVFDVGFYPWWPDGYPYGYPYYGYYPYNYYPSDYYSPSGDYSYGYDSGAYDNRDGGYYDRGAYDSSDQYTDRTIADVQTQLAKEGYYRGDIDGVLGPETRRAIVSFQSDHGLRVTGNLTQETLSTLGL